MPQTYQVLTPSGEPFQMTREELCYLLQRGVVMKLKKSPPRSNPEARQAIKRVAQILGAAFSAPTSQKPTPASLSPDPRNP
jgi:hypothetical protein